jgi:hypothetical protein
MGRKKTLKFRSNDRLLKEAIKKTKNLKSKGYRYRNSDEGFGCEVCALGTIQNLDIRRLGNCRCYFEEMFKLTPDHFKCVNINNEVLDFLLNGNGGRQECKI